MLGQGGREDSRRRHDQIIEVIEQAPRGAGDHVEIVQFRERAADALEGVEVGLGVELATRSSLRGTGHQRARTLEPRHRLRHAQRARADGRQRAQQRELRGPTAIGPQARHEQALALTPLDHDPPVGRGVEHARDPGPGIAVGDVAPRLGDARVQHQRALP